MDGGTPGSPTVRVDLQTLVSAVQNAVQAQNLIATNITKLTAGLAALTIDFAAFLAAFTTAFPPPLSSSVTFNPPSLASGASELTTITVTGAALGNYVQLSFSLDLQGLTLDGYVSAVNTVTAVFSNLTVGAIDLGSGTLKARVTTQ